MVWKWMVGKESKKQVGFNYGKKYPQHCGYELNLEAQTQ